MCLACAGLVDDGVGLAPISVETVPIAFAAPEMVVVKPGDTLALIAKRQSVTVDSLKSWNGLESDTIEVDQVLLVWLPPPAPAQVAAAKPRSGSLDAVLGDGGGGGAETAPADAGSPTLVATADPPPGMVTTDMADGLADAGPIPPAPGKRVVIERPGLASLFGFDAGGEDVDLAQAASGMERHDANLGGGGLGDRSVSVGGGEADSLVMEKRQVRQIGPKIPDTPVATPRLSKPIPKQCLRGPSATVGEDGVVTSAGLTVGQINAGMGQISRHTVRCFPPGTEGSYGVIVEVTVGCNGQVSSVFLVNGGVVPDRVTTCIQQTLGYASFAAHGVPNGVTFQYPMKFTF